MNVLKLAITLPLLATAGAVRLYHVSGSDTADSDSAAQATGFDGFGGFGGFRGLHQFNGFMSNAFGDLEGQFDSSGFNKDFSSAQSKKFDTGYGQHFLENIDHGSFGSELDSSSSQQKQKQPIASPVYSVNDNLKPKTLSQYHQPLPAIKYGVNTHQKPQLVQAPNIAKKTYPASKYTQAYLPHSSVQVKDPYALSKAPQQVTSAYGRVTPSPVTYGLISPSPKSIAKYPTKTIKYTASSNKLRKQQIQKSKDFTENYKPDEGFTFGEEKFY